MTLGILVFCFCIAQGLFALRLEVKRGEAAFARLETWLADQDAARAREAEALAALVRSLAQGVQDEAVRRALKATHDAFSLPPITPFQP